MVKRALIFDFGGVLMKTVDYSPRRSWDRRLGLRPGTVERIVHGRESWRKAQIGAISPDAYWADVAQALDLTDEEVAQLRRDFFSGDRLDTDLVDYIRRLRGDGYPVALLSNDSVELADKLVALGIADLFDPLVISAQIGVMKPHAGAYRAVLEGLKRRGEETVFIDDSLANVTGAAALGIRAIHYTKGMGLNLKPLLKIN